MILVADLGNTSITVGVYQGDKLLANWRLASDKQRSEDEYGVLLLNFLKHAGLDGKLSGAAISSVVLPLTERFKFAIEKYLDVKTLVVNYKRDVGIEIDLDMPEEAGADRLVNAYAASLLYPQPVIVVDFGTYCAEVEHLRVQDITGHSAIISWENGPVGNAEDHMIECFNTIDSTSL